MDSLGRRDLLAATGSVGSVLVAGCLGENEEYGADWVNVERIQLAAAADRWVGVAPEMIEDANNPTLRLIHGRRYEIEWVNQDGRPHALEIQNHEDTVIEGGETLEQEGSTQTIAFDAVFGVTKYTCSHLDATMEGTIEVFTT